MPLTNATSFPAMAYSQADPTGRDRVAVIVKATYAIGAGGRLTPAEEPASLRVADELTRPDSERSSAKYPSDMCLEKVGTDVVVVGDAVSPRPVTVMDVAVQVRKATVTLRVHGDRLFYKGPTGVAVGPAAPFERKAIVYERAFGGASDDYQVLETRNLAGVGIAKRPGDLVDTPAPQIEHPSLPHQTASDRHPPVGLGSILSFWSPRREHIGTLDAAWEADRMPLAPKDFDLRYNNVAHPSLIFEAPLAGGDALGVVGMSLEPLAFELPAVPVVVRARWDVSGRRTVEPRIDTVLIEPNARRVEVVFRTSFLVGRGRDVLRELSVDLSDDA